MCERTYCRHEHERLCSCPPVTCRDALGMAAHLAENMEKVQWSLTYNSLKEIKPYQLCLVGKCRICGGRLCMEQRPVEADSTDGFLAAVYRHLYHFHRSIGQCLPRAAFRTKFVEMFRKEDRAAVEDWLSMPENQSIHAMICGNAKRVYTIVHSWADADQGEFPSPSGVATFTDREKARAELNRLVTEEKENMEIPFSKELYREEYGNDFWEAYRDGYDDVYQQLALRLIKAVAGYDPEKGRLEQHIFAQLKYELLSCRSAYRLCGMTGAPHSFRKSHIISIDTLSENSGLYEETLAA